MTGQTTLLQPPGILPNGQNINIGDVLHINYWGYQSFTKVIDYDGQLGMFGAGPTCFEQPIHQFISNGGEVKKVTPKEVYLFCKKHGWKTERELLLFK